MSACARDYELVRQAYTLQIPNTRVLNYCTELSRLSLTPLVSEGCWRSGSRVVVLCCRTGDWPGDVTRLLQLYQPTSSSWMHGGWGWMGSKATKVSDSIVIPSPSAHVVFRIDFLVHSPRLESPVLLYRCHYYYPRLVAAAASSRATFRFAAGPVPSGRTRASQRQSRPAIPRYINLDIITSPPPLFCSSPTRYRHRHRNSHSE